jgi:hypothetical protein
LLHVAVVVVASGCLLAAWWQATRALSGNSLSWVYSVEWPIFAIIAVAGWWQLLHEDPEAYIARKSRPRYTTETSTPSARAEDSGDGGPVEALVDPVTARWARVLGVTVSIESLLGIMALFSVPLGRPSGWLPAQGRVVFLAHASFGLLLALASVALVARIKGTSRMSHITAWLGLTGVLIAGVGGLLTSATSLIRFLGLALMLVGAMMAAFGYRVPALLARSRRAPTAASAEAAAPPV